MSKLLTHGTEEVSLGCIWGKTLMIIETVVLASSQPISEISHWMNVASMMDATHKPPSSPALGKVRVALGGKTWLRVLWHWLLAVQEAKGTDRYESHCGSWQEAPRHRIPHVSAAVLATISAYIPASRELQAGLQAAPFPQTLVSCRHYHLSASRSSLCHPPGGVLDPRASQHVSGR